MNRPWIIALTGASGTCYGRRLIEAVLTHARDVPLEIIISDAAMRVMREEDGLKSSVGRLTLHEICGIDSGNAVIHSNRNIGASIASGSYRTAGMVIVPCSMRTLAAIAHGLSETLIHRAADVVLKEHRPLVIVPRETPLSRIHLENMLRASDAGARIVPAMPGFYTRPASIQDLVDGMVAKILDQMDLPIEISARWGATVQAQSQQTVS